jgi:uncharacterized damage-inducible protein DinB
MFRRIDDFVAAWEMETEQTMSVLRTLTDASLTQSVLAGGRTLGRLGFHLAQTIPEMMGKAGLPVEGPAEDAPVPGTAREIAEAYQAAAQQLAKELPRTWQDATLLEERSMYGESWLNGRTLQALILHQAHHRGQMTVLMRQAGLRVPGIYGPAREEWAAWGMPAPE